MKNYYSILCSGFLILLGAGFICSQEKSPKLGNDFDKDKILKVWKERQSKVVRAHFDLTCKQMIYKEVPDTSEDKTKTSGKSVGVEPNPPKDIEADGAGIVCIEGSKMKYVHDLPQWSLANRAIYTEHYEDIFDGKLFKSFRTPSSDANSYSLAVIKKADSPPSSKFFYLFPLMITIRGDDEKFVRTLANYELSSHTLLVSNRQCVELISGSNPDQNREVLYLDKDRNYIVVRKSIFIKDVPLWQLDIKYTADPEVGWIPQSWEYMIRNGNNRIEESARWNVAKYFINDSAPSDEINISFPKGTRVIDETGGGEVQYVIQEDGSKGRVIPLSANPTYEDLIQQPRRNKYRLVALASIGVILCLLGLSWLWKIRQRNRASTNTNNDNA
jgi:hypothetical protein